MKMANLEKIDLTFQGRPDAADLIRAGFEIGKMNPNYVLTRVCRLDFKTFVIEVRKAPNAKMR